MGYVTVKVNLDVLFLNANVTIIKSAKGVALPLLNGYNVLLSFYKMGNAAD